MGDCGTTAVIDVRQWARLRAWLGNYFWLPCPACGRMFGGHERGGGALLISSTRTMMCCPRCPGRYIQMQGVVYELLPELDEDGISVLWVVYTPSP